MMFVVTNQDHRRVHGAHGLFRTRLPLRDGAPEHVLAAPYRQYRRGNLALALPSPLELFFFNAPTVERNPEKKEKKRKFLPNSRKIYSRLLMDSSEPEKSDEMSNSWGTFFWVAALVENDRLPGSAFPASISTS